MKFSQIAFLSFSTFVSSNSSTNAFQVAGFVPVRQKVSRSKTLLASSFASKLRHIPGHRRLLILSGNGSSDDDDNDEEEVENPYADPNYPDLEFVNYDDPEYVVDQGVSDEFFDTDAKVEEMREERRTRNDEFQYETYHVDTLKSGDSYKGEWTVYRTSTFLDGVEDSNEGSDIPSFKKEKRVRKVVTMGKKVMLEGEFESRLDGEHIVHMERLAKAMDFEDDEEWEEYIATNGKVEGHDDAVGVKRYWPMELKARDFRGEAGIMCVGNCYTICDAIALDGEDKDHFDGPFQELRTEIGIQYKRLRFRVKWDYRVKQGDMSKAHPDLHLYSMIVCRETRERWPRYVTKTNVDESIAETLFGEVGASGGLYDPPPVGSDEQAMQYMLLDLEGNATVLFPYKINQDPEAFDGNGWVQSLDWSPGRIRFQADRKVLGGKKIRGLRTLELSEVEAKSADQWRPKDNGQNMRQ